LPNQWVSQEQGPEEGKSGMPDTTTIGIFAENAAQEAYLAHIVRLAGCTPETYAGPSHILLTTRNDYPRDGTQDIFQLSHPLKAADLIEKLRNLAASKRSVPAEIRIGHAILDTVENFWRAGNAPPVRLTEKETEILLCLHGAAGKSIAREDLLHKVWAYAPEAETHTLETHIYRLRQKIEEDPSAPSVLLTDGDGYRLSF